MQVVSDYANPSKKALMDPRGGSSLTDHFHTLQNLCCHTVCTATLPWTYKSRCLPRSV